MGYSPWGLKESDTTEQLSTAHSAKGLHGLSAAGVINLAFIPVTCPSVCLACMWCLEVLLMKVGTW